MTDNLENNLLEIGENEKMYTISENENESNHSFEEEHKIHPNINEYQT
jgi:hypothetical protein